MCCALTQRWLFGIITAAPTARSAGQRPRYRCCSVHLLRTGVTADCHLTFLGATSQLHLRPSFRQWWRKPV